MLNPPLSNVFYHIRNPFSRNNHNGQIKRFTDILNSFVDFLTVQFFPGRVDKKEPIPPTLSLQKKGDPITETKRPSRSHNHDAFGFKKFLKTIHGHKTYSFVNLVRNFSRALNPARTI